MIETSKEIIESRISICKSCPELTRLKTCSKCGCFMPAKVRFSGSSCPIGKWGKSSNSKVTKKVYENIPAKHLDK